MGVVRRLGSARGTWIYTANVYGIVFVSACTKDAAERVGVESFQRAERRIRPCERSPILRKETILVEGKGFEPSASALRTRRSPN